jgi:hypothetical protein
VTTYLKLHATIAGYPVILACKFSRNKSLSAIVKIACNFNEISTNYYKIFSGVITAGHLGQCPGQKNRLCRFLQKIKKKYFFKKYTTLQDILIMPLKI